MEQDPEPWQYRLRWQGEDFGPAVTAAGVVVRLPLENFIAPVTGQWRPSATAPWQDMPPMDFAKTQARFAVRLAERRDFGGPDPSDNELHVISLVRGEPCWFCLTMPRRVVAADGPEELQVDGIAGTCSVAAVIAFPGEFSYSDACYQVANLAVSVPGLVAAAAAVPAVNPNIRGGFMASQGRMTPDEVEQLQLFIGRHV